MTTDGKLKRTVAILLVCLLMIGVFTACGKKQDESLACWNAESPAMASIIAFVASVTDESAKGFETVSMRGEFETIYKRDALKTKLDGN